MKYDEVKFYDEKTKSLTLVTKVKDRIKGEVETKTYPFPLFVEGIYTKRAIELGAELEASEYVVTGDLFERLTKYFVELYDKQFTEKELMNGISQEKIVNTFLRMLFGVLQGDLKEA